MPWIPILIGAGLGVAQAGEQVAEEKAKQPEVATTEEYAPFTGASIDKAQASLHPAQFASDIIGGAAMGGAASQAINGTKLNLSVQDPAANMKGLDQSKFWSGANPYAAGAGGTGSYSPYYTGAATGSALATGAQQSPYYSGNPSQATPWSLLTPAQQSLQKGGS